MEMFGLVSERISTTWSASIRIIDGSSHLILQPVDWHRPGFRDDYWDRRWEGAGEAFERAVAAMAAEESSSASGQP